ncbi:MAG: 2-amino-4-hydroxy-6-hydroxymethyldihydropteridine diphosphokinase, partial [Deltaproteobacteria bacterium]
RKPTFRWGPRVIDLDLLLYGEEVIEEEDLKVPHPLMHERPFVLVPLVEIAPWAYHPVKGKTARELLDEIGGPRGVQYFGRFEERGCPSSL